MADQDMENALRAIVANDRTTYRHGQVRPDGKKPSEAEIPGSIWLTPKEIAENALKHLELERDAMHEFNLVDPAPVVSPPTPEGLRERFEKIAERIANNWMLSSQFNSTPWRREKIVEVLEQELGPRAAKPEEKA
jgi:hypothetical protein